MFASVYTLRQFLWFDFAAIRAKLACILWINQYDTTTSLFRFVHRELYELIPRCINNALGKVVILHHALYVEALESNETTLIDEFPRYLVCIILTLVRNMCMQSCQLTNRLTTTI